MSKIYYFKKVVYYVPNKLKAINSAVDKLISAPERTEKAFNYLTKVTGASVGSAGAAKGTVDFAEALVCQDGVCAVVSAIGVAADGLGIACSFVPGPNITSVITIPVSVGCKTFVWCCKRSKLPWGSC